MNNLVADLGAWWPIQRELFNQRAICHGQDAQTHIPTKQPMTMGRFAARFL